MIKNSDTQGKSRKRHSLQMDEKIDFIKKARNVYQKDVAADRHNIEPAREDIRFVIGDQWDEVTKSRRTRLNKPVLTVNRLPAFVAQYLGSWQQTDTTMKLVPTKGGTKIVAEIRQGLIRSIVKEPVAKHSIYTAMETAYICGIGNFGLELRETKNDIFTTEMAIVGFDDPFQVIWDRAAREPSGSDANHCFAMHYMTKDDFKKSYPDKTVTGWYMDEADDTTMTMNGWETEEMIRVCHFWQMQKEPVTFGLEKESGDVIDVTDQTDEERRQNCDTDKNGELMVRDTYRTYAECYVLSGAEVLEGPFRLNISRVPIFRVEGPALQEASVRYRWGFVRNSKDPQRLHNYWRSILAEELMKSAASKWLLDQTAMKSGLADQFRKAHLSGDNVLFWDSQSDGAKPEFIAPPMVNQAVMTESQMTVQDIRDVTNKHQASMGVQSNEVSGKAISARQRVSELGDRIYLENMNMALSECAMVMNELIPEVYDTERVIKVMGDDDEYILQTINGGYGDETPDITRGKYEITAKTGPSYATMREESVETMLTMMNHMPQTANYIADIIASNMDIPGADEISERLMSLLPPGMVDPNRLPEAKRQQFLERQKQMQEQQQKQEAIQMEMLGAQFAELEAKVRNLQAQAMKSEAQAQREMSEVGVQGTKVESQHMLGEEKNRIDAAQVGIAAQKTENDEIKMGMDVAYKADEMSLKREQAQQKQQQPKPNVEGED